MAVKIGIVSTFADVKPDKAQAVKILEESAEVFSAWENSPFPHICQNNMHSCAVCENNPLVTQYGMCNAIPYLVNECADVIQATCNLLAALGVDDLTAVLDRCKQKNIERGREYER